MPYIMSIDQGTTSSRVLIFDERFREVARAQMEFPQIYPASGWVEHDPEDIWNSVLNCMRQAVEKAGINAIDILSLGITNQRETTLIWDRKTGAPVYNAIVWQDRRTAAFCAALKDEGHEAEVSAQTGLLLDPYFSASKIRWILDEIDDGQVRAERGDLLFGTVDSFLLWRLTGGKTHATDATNASRTMLYDIRAGAWSADMCALFQIPTRMLPRVSDCADNFGMMDIAHLGAPIPICGIAGDQQAATIGQACFDPGMLKATFGTGCFALMNTGRELVRSENRLLSTIAYQFDGVPTYALEGAIFVSGAVVQWIRDELQFIENASEIDGLARVSMPDHALVLVPAFTGLAAPYWEPDCRGAMFGLTRDAGRPEIARAALESVGYQLKDLMQAMYSDWDQDGDYGRLRVDGGMAQSDFTMQFVADIIGAAVDRPRGLESTAIGAAWLAGMWVGIYPNMTEISRKWRAERSFAPAMDDDLRTVKYARWKRAVRAAIAL